MQSPTTASTDLGAALKEGPRVETGLVEFLSTRFRAHEPIYFIAGPLNPNTKFQISLKYQLFSDGGEIDERAPWASSLYVAYSQTSFWDIGGDSSPFFDTSYRPEFLYQLGPAAGGVDGRHDALRFPGRDQARV